MLPATGVGDAAPEDERVTLGELAALRASVTRLEAEVTDLRALVDRLARDLGVNPG